MLIVSEKQYETWVIDLLVPIVSAKTKGMNSCRLTGSCRMYISHLKPGQLRYPVEERFAVEPSWSPTADD